MHTCTPISGISSTNTSGNIHEGGAARGIRWLSSPHHPFLGFPGGSDSKESACNVGDLGLIPELGTHFMATHFSVLAWRIPWTESLAGYSPWGCKRVRHD